MLKQFRSKHYFDESLLRTKLHNYSFLTKVIGMLNFVKPAYF